MSTKAQRDPGDLIPLLRDNSLKTGALLATLDLLRANTLNLHDAIKQYIIPDSLEVTRVLGKTATVRAAYREYSSSLNDSYQAQVKLREGVLEVLRQMRVDGREAKSLDLQDDDDIPYETRTTRTQLPVRETGVESAPTNTKPGPSGTNLEEEGDTLTPNEPSSADEEDIFHLLRRAEQARGRTAPEFLRQSEEVEHCQRKLASSPSVSDFDPYGDTVSERQARFESWYSLHPSLRAAAQRSSSRDAAERYAEERRRQEKSMAAFMEKERIRCDQVLKEAEAEKMEKRKKKQEQKLASRRRESETAQEFSLLGPTPSVTDASSLDEGSSLPERLRKDKGKGKGKAQEFAHTHRNVPFSTVGPRLFYGKLRGGAGPPPSLHASISRGRDNDNSFVKAIADAHVRDTEEEWEFGIGNADIFPVVSGHVLQLGPRGMRAPAARTMREGFNRTDQELFAERAAWQQEEDLKSRERYGTMARGRHFP